MTSGPRPPRLARWLLERALPLDARDAIVGDLDEFFRRDCRDRGLTRARLRCWRRAASFAMHFGRERWRERRSWTPGLKTRPPLIARPVEAGSSDPADERRSKRFAFSWLDIKLGLRMLIRYPGLTLVGGIGLAVVVAGGSAVAILNDVVYATLPFDEGERVVVLENWDTEWNNQEHRVLHDYAVWREELQSVEDIGAFRPVRRNLIVGDQAPRLVRVAEMTASGFRLARVPPMLGRHLVDGDERLDAPAAVVIGEEIWRREFAGDPGVLDRTLRLGATAYTVVGVMPATFLFPENDRIWIPLRPGPDDYNPRSGPLVYVFGRLASGVDLSTAQAELTTMGQRAAARYPDTHARLTPRVTAYARSYFDDMEGYELPVFRALVILLLIIIGSNVAVLTYARTTTRRIEIALRTALGAGRGRIVGQLLVESFLLASVAAGVGLLLAQVLVTQVDAFIDRIGGAPFWMSPTLASTTVLRDVVGLTVLGAVVIGLMPALQATGRRAQAGLQHASASRAAGRLGRTHTFLIVAQVAIAVALLPVAGSFGWSSIRYAVADPGFDSEEYLTARVAMEGSGVDWRAVFDERVQELVRRLDAEPSVAATGLLASVPGAEPTAPVDVEPASSNPRMVQVSLGRIGTGYFDLFDVPILGGRSFNAGDFESPHAAIVNNSFVRDVFGGRPALGGRLRVAARGNTPAGPWLEIVGVASDFPAAVLGPGTTMAKVYIPVASWEASRLALRLRDGGSGWSAEHLRRVAADLDPTLQVRDAQPLDAVMGGERLELNLAAWGTGIVACSVLLQSAAGLYALMSFAVAHRRREIGIRAALGANPRRILAGIFGRAFWQLGAGVVAGSAVAFAVNSLTDGELTGEVGPILLPIVASVMVLVGLLAAIVPARRGLRIQPTEALRED